jgi:uncharacterized protein (DUF2141 family)
MPVTNITCNGNADGKIILDVKVPTPNAFITITNTTTGTVITALPTSSPPGAVVIPFPSGTIETDTNGKYKWENLGPGKYTIEVIDSSVIRCTSSVDTEILEPDSVTGDYEIIPGPCGDSKVTLLALGSGGTPGYKYTLENTGIGYGPVTRADGEFKGILPDTVNNYTLTITDKNNCTYNTSFLVNSNPNFSLQIGIQNVSCFGSCDGEIKIVSVGGVAPYRFVLSSQPPGTYINSSDCEPEPDCEDTFTFKNLCAGDYSITAFDSNGCTVTYPSPSQAPWITISQPTEIVVGTTTTAHVSCASCCDGSFEIATITGGSPNYEVFVIEYPDDFTVPSTIFTDGTTPSRISNLKPGNYTVRIKDSNGCFKDVKVGINAPENIKIVV